MDKGPDPKPRSRKKYLLASLETDIDLMVQALMGEAAKSPERDIEESPDDSTENTV